MKASNSLYFNNIDKKYFSQKVWIYDFNFYIFVSQTKSWHTFWKSLLCEITLFTIREIFTYKINDRNRHDSQESSLKCF
jgi:hypothetical protein